MQLADSIFAMSSIGIFIGTVICLIAFIKMLINLD